jgi:hypothetical protein
MRVSGHAFDACPLASDLAAAKMSDERPSFVAHPLCPPHLCRHVEDVANSFNPNWLLPPQTR